jgi:hypothetical protein
MPGPVLRNNIRDTDASLTPGVGSKIQYGIRNSFFRAPDSDPESNPPLCLVATYFLG